MQYFYRKRLEDLKKRKESFHVRGADARARCSAGTRDTGREVFICGPLLRFICVSGASAWFLIGLDRSPLAAVLML